MSESHFVAPQRHNETRRYFIIRFKPCRFLKILLIFCVFLSVFVVFRREYWSVFVMSLIMLIISSIPAYYIKVVEKHG